MYYVNEIKFAAVKNKKIHNPLKYYTLKWFEYYSNAIGMYCAIIHLTL